jgi:hypothetical protein
LPSASLNNSAFSISRLRHYYQSPFRTNRVPHRIGRCLPAAWRSHLPVLPAPGSQAQVARATRAMVPRRQVYHPGTGQAGQAGSRQASCIVGVAGVQSSTRRAVREKPLWGSCSVTVQPESAGQRRGSRVIWLECYQYGYYIYANTNDTLAVGMPYLAGRMSCTG